MNAEMASVVVLDRVEDVSQDLTPYCVHGRATCCNCRKWCWLGSETVKAVQAGIRPLCRQCAVRLIPPSVAEGPGFRDHLREDGAH